MLSPNSREALLRAARGAAERAYAPYSQFCVGAAVLGASGKTYVGVNVENVSYGLSICAERAAVFAAIAAGENELLAVAIYTPTALPTPPCGACRQVLSEFGAKARVLSVCDGEGVIETTLDALLPGAFDRASLDARPSD